jgi:hypothetical protein
MYNFLRAPGGPGGAPPRAPGGERAAPAGPPPGGGGRPTNVGSGACVINGFGGLTSYSTTILINPRQVMFLMEENHILRWATFADRHNPAAKPSYTGDSIALGRQHAGGGHRTGGHARQAGHRAFCREMAKLPDGNIAIERLREATMVNWPRWKR